MGIKNVVAPVGNVIDNVISTPFRWAGIVANTALDISDTLNNLYLRGAEITKNTTQQMRDIISESGRWSFWKRLLKVPLWAGLAVGKWVEGAVRSVVTPLWHWLRDGFDTVGNPIMNTGRAITYIPNTNPADTYKFNKLNARDYNKTWWNWMKLMPWQKGSDGSANGEAPAEPAPVVSEPDPIVVPAIDPTWVASMEDRSKQLSDAVEKLSQDNAALAQENKRLQKEVSAVKKADADENNTETNNEGDKKIDAMKKDAEMVRNKLTNALPTDYEISWDDVSKWKFAWMQKLAANHKDKEKKHDPEIAITIYEPGKLRVRYNPQKNHGSVEDLNYSYYMGETTMDGLDGYLSAITGVVSPVDSEKPDFKALEAAGLKKEVEDGDKHGYRHEEGPFGARDQNKEHHNKEKAKRSKK